VTPLGHDRSNFVAASEQSGGAFGAAIRTDAVEQNHAGLLADRNAAYDLLSFFLLGCFF
jgi:hypothetical protein